MSTFPITFSGSNKNAITTPSPSNSDTQNQGLNKLPAEVFPPITSYLVSPSQDKFQAGLPDLAEPLQKRFKTIVQDLQALKSTSKTMKANLEQDSVSENVSQAFDQEVQARTNRVDAKLAIRDDNQKARAIQGLLENLTGVPKAAHSRVIDAATSRTDRLPFVLKGLTKEGFAYLSEAARSRLFTSIVNIPSEHDKSNVITGLIKKFPELTPAERTQLIDTAVAMNSEYYKAHVITGLIKNSPDLTPAERTQLIDTTVAMNSEHYKADVIRLLIKKFPELTQAEKEKLQM